MIEHTIAHVFILVFKLIPTENQLARRQKIQNCFSICLEILRALDKTKNG